MNIKIKLEEEKKYQINKTLFNLETECESMDELISTDDSLYYKLFANIYKICRNNGWFNLFVSVNTRGFCFIGQRVKIDYIKEEYEEDKEINRLIKFIRKGF